MKAFPGYFISRFGDVYTAKRVGKLMKPSVVKGYEVVTLYNAGKFKKQVKIHRLVMEYWVGPCPKSHQVCHNDGDRLNNCLENLRYGTISDNQRDRVKHGTDVRGVKSPNTTLTEDDVQAIFEDDRPHRTIAEDYEVGKSSITRIKSRKTWKHVTRERV